MPLNLGQIPLLIEEMSGLGCGFFFAPQLRALVGEMH
jgi:hypothetical protein